MGLNVEGGRRTEDVSAQLDKRGRRTDAMFVAAYIAVAGLVYTVVFIPGVGEYAQGVITLVLGAFLNELKNMYIYEIGTTRTAQAQDEVIKDIVKTVAANGNGHVKE